MEDFEEKFFDIKEHRPKKGQVLARFTAMADFVDDWLKRNVIELLQKNPHGAESAVKVMRNLVGATEKDSILIPKRMADDLIKGKTVNQVAKNPYRFQIEKFYWAEPDDVPNSPHWTSIKLLNNDEENKEIT